MEGYNKIDKQIHQLSQLIAKANKTFVPKKEDDSHTNLDFDAITHRIYGRWIKSSKGNIILALNLERFAFEWLDDNYYTLQSHAIEGKTSAQLEDDIANEFPAIGLEEKDFKAPLHFEIPVYDFKDAAYSTFDDAALATWEQYRSLANEISIALLALLGKTAEVRIWPHHFDTGIYVGATEKLGIGFGLAMEDSVAGSPYFYFSGYGLNGNTIDYSNVPTLTIGKFIVGENWNGAVITLAEIKEEKAAGLQVFLKEVSQWFLN